MSREHLVRTVANTIATVGLRFNMTGKQPSDLYHAMAEHLADAQLLQSPETAAELEAEPLALPWAHVMPDDDLHGFLGDLVSAAIGRWQHSPEVPDRDVLAAVEKACAAWRTPGRGYRSDEPTEPQRPADEDPIRFTLTDQGEVFVPRTERQRWQDIADALNAAHAAGMPVGIDLDGTLTDRRMWSVVWLSTEERWTVAGWEDDAEAAAEVEPAPVTIYRAEHPDSGITLGHYGTAAAARAHCEATERRSWPTGTTLAFDWIEDEDDGVAELVVTAGQNEESATGYIVTALDVPSEYDEEADE